MLHHVRPPIEPLYILLNCHSILLEVFTILVPTLSVSKWSLKELNKLSQDHTALRFLNLGLDLGSVTLYLHQLYLLHSIAILLAFVTYS